MTEREIALSQLTQPQRRIISLNDVTLDKEELYGEEREAQWFYFIAGVYHQQRGFKTASEAYQAAIYKILNDATFKKSRG